MTVTIRVLAASALDGAVEALSRILTDSVAMGAAISFMHPLSRDEAEAFWKATVRPEVEAGRRVLLVAEEAGQVVGTVQVILAMPPNQPHRCEIAKMAVHPAVRRKGIGCSLMKEALQLARSHGKSLATLDTRTGDAAEPLYAALGFEVAGVVPGFALNPDGRGFHATTYMYRRL